MSETLIVVTQYLRLMLSVDSSPWDQRTTSLGLLRVWTLSCLYILEEQEDSSLRQEEQWPCF